MHDTNYVRRLTSRGGLPELLKVVAQPDDEIIIVRERRIRIAVISSAIGAAFVGGAIGGYYYIGPGPGNLNQFALWCMLVGSLPFWIFGAAVGGLVTEFRYERSKDAATLQVRWYDRVTVSYMGGLSDVELIVRPITLKSDGTARSLWSGLVVLKGQRMLAMAVSGRAEVALEHMERFGELLGIPVRIEDSDLHVERL